MAADVLYGDTGRERSARWMGLVLCLLFIPLALAPYPDLTGTAEPSTPEWGYTSQLWYMRVFLLVLALPALRRVMKLGRAVPVPTLEVGADVIRWSNGASDERTITRAAVRSASCGPMWVRFEPAGGGPIDELYVIHFDHDEVKAALGRHGWLGEPDRTVEEAMKRAYPSSARKLGRWLGGGRRGRQRP